MGKGNRVKISTGDRCGSAPTGAKGGLGQHFLKNVAVVKNIVNKAGVKSTDIVLEIGPGNGIMTLELLKVAKKVIAVEIDERMIMEVKKRLQGQYKLFHISELESHLQIIQGDVLKINLPYFDICVSNIPYQVNKIVEIDIISFGIQIVSTQTIL